MVGKSISIRESQIRLLRIAEYFKTVCEENGIPYYMLGGTMLGAIRHNGFIPWDDDMDFGVPIEYYERLRDLLKTDLPDNIRVCEYQNCRGCRTVFIKMDASDTIIDDKCVDLPLEEKLGVNIDIFPLVTCTHRGPKVLWHLFLTKFNSAVFTEPISGSKAKHRIKKILQALVPFRQNRLLDYIWNLTLSINKGDCYGNLFGRYRSREIISKEIFGTPISYTFEDTTFYGPQQYDAYLTLLYNDYMVIPPSAAQSNHSSAIFERI